MVLHIPKIQPLGIDISGITYTTLSKTWTLQRKFQWQLFMPHTINGVFGHLISPLCQDIRFGDYSISSLSTMQYGAAQRFYAGIPTINNVGMTFVMPTDNAVLDYFNGWFELMIDRQGYYHPKNEYKRDIYVHLFDRTGVESVRFTLKGAFVVQRPIFDPSFAADDILRISFNVSVDKIEMFSLISSIRSAVFNNEYVSGAVNAISNAGNAVTKRIRTPF